MDKTINKSQNRAAEARDALVIDIECAIETILECFDTITKKLNEFENDETLYRDQLIFQHASEDFVDNIDEFLDHHGHGRV